MDRSFTCFSLRPDLEACLPVAFGFLDCKQEPVQPVTAWFVVLLVAIYIAVLYIMFHVHVVAYSYTQLSNLKVDNTYLTWVINDVTQDFYTKFVAYPSDIVLWGGKACYLRWGGWVYGMWSNPSFRSSSPPLGWFTCRHWLSQYSNPNIVVFAFTSYHCIQGNGIPHSPLAVLSRSFHILPLHAWCLCPGLVFTASSIFQVVASRFWSHNFHVFLFVSTKILFADEVTVFMCFYSFLVPINDTLIKYHSIHVFHVLFLGILRWHLLLEYQYLCVF